MKLKSSLSTFFLAAAGMMVGARLSHFADAWLPAAHAAETRDVLSTQGLELVDKDGRRQILIAMTDGGTPGVWFFDRQGKARLNLGIYDDGHAAVVLNDVNEQAVQIFRTVGAENRPVLVMKSGGRDRIVMGLNGAAAEPFLVTYNEQGAKTTLFGSY
jgi:hypothetical protein